MDKSIGNKAYTFWGFCDIWQILQKPFSWFWFLFLVKITFSSYILYSSPSWLGCTVFYTIIGRWNLYVEPDFQIAPEFRSTLSTQEGKLLQGAKLFSSTRSRSPVWPTWQSFASLLYGESACTHCSSHLCWDNNSTGVTEGRVDSAPSITDTCKPSFLDPRERCVGISNCPSLMVVRWWH